MKKSLQKKLIGYTTATAGLLAVGGLLAPMPAAMAAPGAFPAPTGISRHDWINRTHQQATPPSSDTSVHQRAITVRNDDQGHPHTVS